MLSADDLLLTYRTYSPGSIEIILLGIGLSVVRDGEE